MQVIINYAVFTKSVIKRITIFCGNSRHTLVGSDMGVGNAVIYNAVLCPILSISSKVLEYFVVL